MANSTLKQIATELNLSASTVSRAINGKSVVNADTRERVLALAKKYSYTPNEIARSLQKCSTQTIAVVLPDISENFFGTIVKEIDKVVSSHGYMLILSDTQERTDKEIKHLDKLFTRQVDALVLATVLIDGSSISRFKNSGKPIIFIDNIPRLDGVDAITIDNQKASRMAIDFLVERGHTSIATIVGTQTETTGFERLVGYKNAIQSHNLTLNENLISIGDFKRESGYTAMKRLLEQRNDNPFTAVYVTSEKMTYGAMQAIYESGLRVPEDISVMGFDVHQQNTFGPQITSILQPEKEIGQLVGKQLMDRLQNPSDNQGEHILLTPLINEGNTVCNI